MSWLGLVTTTVGPPAGIVRRIRSSGWAEGCSSTLDASTSRQQQPQYSATVGAAAVAVYWTLSWAYAFNSFSLTSQILLPPDTMNTGMGLCLQCNSFSLTSQILWLPDTMNTVTNLCLQLLLFDFSNIVASRDNEHCHGLMPSIASLWLLKYCGLQGQWTLSWAYAVNSFPLTSSILLPSDTMNTGLGLCLQ